MAVLSKMYFNAVFGALGGLVGWMLFGVLGEKVPWSDDLNAILGGALIGGSIGYFVVGVEAIRDQSLIRFARLGTYGFIIAMVGGAIGMYVGDRIQEFIIWLIGNHLILRMFARGLGWSLLGIAIGGAEGIAARSFGKFSYGTIGGLFGGFIGGIFFELFYSIAREARSTTYFWSALGLVILGACIGSLSALVQSVFQPANIKVLRGWQEGREYPLDKPQSMIGRDEHSDIPLYRDMKIEKKHCYVKSVNGKYILVNNGAPPEFTLVNDQPVTGQCELRDGDRIQLGNVLLKFQLRAAVNRPRGRRHSQPAATVPRFPT